MPLRKIFQSRISLLFFPHPQGPIIAITDISSTDAAFLTGQTISVDGGVCDNCYMKLTVD